MNTHKDGTLPQNGEIFVFGSNLLGVHGAGAAKAAYDHYGADWGKGVGLSGSSYAIPTKAAPRRGAELSLEIIKGHVAKFANWVLYTAPNEFFLTRVGCGLAGYKDEQVAPIFFEQLRLAGALDRVSIPEAWLPYFTQPGDPT